MGDPFPAFDLNVRIEEDDDELLDLDNNNGTCLVYSVCSFLFYIESKNV
jgi:hypothetical protein